MNAGHADRVEFMGYGALGGDHFALQRPGRNGTWTAQFFGWLSPWWDLFS
jgi:hypothetical protein